MHSTQHPDTAHPIRVRLALACAMLLLAIGCGRQGGNIYEAIQAGDTRRVEALLKADPALIRLTDKRGASLLHGAALWNHVAVAKLLLSRGADIETRNGHGKTPLHWAALCGNQEMVEFLSSQGADIHARDNNGKTALHCCAVVGRQFVPDPRVAGVLLSHGADINARDRWNWTALEWAIFLGHEPLAQFLVSRGADVDVFAAAGLGNMERVQQMLRASPNLACAADSIGLTPLHWAAKAGKTAMVELLLAQGADVDARDHEGRTPLQAAATFDRVDMVELLLVHHADPNVSDAAGRTALRIALSENETALATLLDGYGAESTGGSPPSDLACLPDRFPVLVADVASLV